MRIAQVAPLYESVPPKLYGGTERVVAYLTDELVRLGHHVTLFASGDSRTSATLVPRVAEALRLSGSCTDHLAPHLLMVEKVAQTSARVRPHSFPYRARLHFPVLRRMPSVAHVTTLHGRLDLAELRPLYREFADMPVVSISDAQRRPLPGAGWIGNGLPRPATSSCSRFMQLRAAIWRFSDASRQKSASIARSRSPRHAVSLCGLRPRSIPPTATISIAKSAPLLDNPFVEFIGEIADEQKSEFLGRAKALLFPIDWPEPFGLVMVEALACGVPVIAFPGGSVPELIDHGVTGFIVDSVDDAIDAVCRVESIDRRACRETFERRFAVRRMASDYVERLSEDWSARHQAWWHDGPAPWLKSISLDEQLRDRRRGGDRGRANRVLKHGDTFGVFDLHGDVLSLEKGEQGLYHAGTRFLSRFELLLGRRRPLLLSSTISEDNTVLAADLTNPDVVQGDRVIVPRGSLHIFRARAYCGTATASSGCGSRTTRCMPIQMPLALQFDADFCDVFEVRGTRRDQRGHRGDDRFTADGGVLRYVGLDRHRTANHHQLGPAARSRYDNGSAVVLDHAGTPAGHRDRDRDCLRNCRTAQRCSVCRCRTAVQKRCRRARDRPLRRVELEREPQSLVQPIGGRPAHDAHGDTAWDLSLRGDSRGSARRSAATGSSPPWRLLWASPGIARGVLDVPRRDAGDQRVRRAGRAARQDPSRNARRRDGRARRGSVRQVLRQRRCDAAVRHARGARTSNGRPIASSSIACGRTSLPRSSGWKQYGDADRDGFIEYARRSDTGLIQQGWKDSHDSVFHADGALADAPIAMCEIQGYAYQAWRGAAKLAKLRGDLQQSRDWRTRAARLLSRFDRAFWCEDLETYRPRARRREAAVPCAHFECRARAVQPGSRNRSRARALADVLMDDAIVRRLGRANGGVRRSPLQPDVVSQRLGVAARQRAGRRGARAVRLHQRSHAAS